jgi:prepilin-type N-terminal cleavage/methylation domain-containing protein
MNTKPLTFQARRRPRRHAFTLIELLVVVGVITILASITLPMVLKTFDIGQTTRCVSNIAQISRCSIAYSKDYGMLLVCGGNRDGEHDWNYSGPNRVDAGPVYDGPWDLRRNTDVKYPFWYEALQPYTSPGSSLTAASASYKKRTGVTISPATPNATDRDKLRDELANLVGLYRCPGKRQANQGYGYNYAAVFGVSGIFQWDTSSDTGNGNPYFLHLQWRTQNVNTGILETRPAPVMRFHDDANQRVQQAIHVLWYAQNIAGSALMSPSRTIAFCDAGWVTNDTDPVNNPTAPRDWTEYTDVNVNYLTKTTNVTGYVRFPLDVGINNQAYINGAKYKSGKPWRPVPRHKGRTVIGNFDGSGARVPIENITSFPYGDPKCLYGNTFKKEPPLSPYQGY